MSDNQPKIFYTKTDEAPALATYSFLSIVKGFIATAGVEVELKDVPFLVEVERKMHMQDIF